MRPPPPNVPLPRRAARALAALALAAASCGEQRRPTGVILISVDSLRADHLSCTGYRSPTRPDVLTTPAIDRLLAARGTRFETVISTTSWTLPSHMAMLTGQPDELHGVRDLPDRLHPSETMIQQVFREAGWRTAGFWSGPNLHPWFGFERGFELYRDCSSSRVADPGVFRVEDDAQFEEVQSLHEASHAGITGPVVVDAFEEWFGELGSDEPFFAFVHLWDVHYDYTPPPEFDVFDPHYRGQVDGHDFHRLVLPQPIDPADVFHLIALYDGEIRFTDHNVGRLLALVEQAGRLDDTLVVFTADHGEEFLEHTLFGHKNSLYEEVLRVPLILRWPAGVPADHVVETPVSLVDVAPTILDLVGLPRPAGMWGRSLVPALDGDLDPRLSPVELTSRHVEIEARGVHGGDHKVMQMRRRQGTLLLDLANDPHEENWIPARELPESDRRVGAALQLWKQLEEEARTRQRLGADAMPEGLTRDLEDVGYLGADDEPDTGE